MARDVNTLVIGMKAILSPLITELDFRQPYIPFNDEVIFFLLKQVKLVTRSLAALLLDMHNVIYLSSVMYNI